MHYIYCTLHIGVYAMNNLKNNICGETFPKLEILQLLIKKNF